MHNYQIPFSGLEYLYIIGDDIFWKSEGNFNESVFAKGFGENKEYFSSETGCLGIKYIQSHIVLFDSKTDLFSVFIYLNGTSICFKTKKAHEAHDLFSTIQEIIYGFRDIEDSPDISSLGISTLQS